MKEMRNENKKSKLIFDPRITRKLLKLNDEPKYCPYCGKALAEQCDCHKNMVIDVKPLRGSTEASIAVFANTESFQKDLTQVMDELKAKAEAEKSEDTEQVNFDID
jgi:hypothetical protein